MQILNMFNTIAILKIYDPLEQFDIFLLTSYVNLTSFSFFFIFLIISLYKLQKPTVNGIFDKNVNYRNNTRNFIFDFVSNITKSNIAVVNHFFIALYVLAFIFIFGSNMFGLIPFSYTITSSFIITFSAAFIYFVVINALAIYNKGFFIFFSMFFPAGSPVQIAPLLVVIEIVSYIARVLSLSIRLFANMMAGHTLLKILIGFSFSMLLSESFIAQLAILPWLLVTMIIILEILISLLQSYVFLILICIYTNDVLNAH